MSRLDRAMAANKPPPIERTTSNTNHQEAIEFVERNRDILEHYAGRGINIKPPPPGLDTFAFDLQTDDIYANGMFYKNRGYSDEKTAYAMCHEIGHFNEKKQLLAEKRGPRTFADYLKRIEKSKAFSLMDNCVSDIRQNRDVNRKTNRSMAEVEKRIYRENAFPETDFRETPEHVQFCEALLRESRVPEDTCTVSPRVREKLDALRSIKNSRGARLVDVMTNPDLPMSERLRLQDKFVWPVVEELLREDMENKKRGQGKSEGSGKEKTPGKPTPEGKGGGKADPNEMFADAYAQAAEKILNAAPMKENKKMLEDAKKMKGGPDPAEAAYAEALGVKPEELHAYRALTEEIAQIVNPETNERVVDELRALIERIIAKRMRPAIAPRYPTDEGEDLVDPAELVAQVRAGNLEPQVWETHEEKERFGARFGEVEITLVNDRSGSMKEGNKAREQQKAAVMLLEALKEFAERCDEERTRVDKPLEVRSEVYSFQATDEDKKPLKKMSKELGEKERIDIATKLGSTPGQNTTDYITLETILGTLTEEQKRSVENGELKKIVAIFTDGESGNRARVQTALEKLRAAGVIVVGIGITEGGRAALSTYAPGARLAPKAEALAVVLGDVLKEHLADV